MKRILRLAGLTAATGALALLVALAILGFLTASYAVVVLGNTPWNFPGDPPTFKLLVVPAALATALALFLRCVLRAPGTNVSLRLFNRTIAVALFSSVGILLMCA